MELCFIFFSYLTCLIVKGVFGDEVKSVSVMEGESVTLNTDIIKQKGDLIVWSYGPKNTVVAKINGEAGSMKVSDDERFRDRLKQNDKTGDLTISDIRTTDSGLYQLRISSNSKFTYKKFNLTVYAHVSVPAINPTKSTKLCDNCSESPDQRVNVITAVVVSTFCVMCIIIIISVYIYRRTAKDKLSEGINRHTDEKRSINCSSTSEDEEPSSFLNGKQHWIGAGSV